MDTEKNYDLCAYGILACREAWEKSTDAWCDVREFNTGGDAIYLCFLACGFGIATDGKTRRLVYGGSVWCCAATGKRHASVVLSANSRLYGMRLEPPQHGKGWCGQDFDSALRAWKVLKSRVDARPVPVPPDLESGMMELFAELASYCGESMNASVCMTFGSLVSRSFDALSHPLPDPHVVKSAERVLAYLETCAIKGLPTIEKVASRLGYCPGHVMMSFRTSFGVTLKQCMDMIRCEYAIRRIRAGDTVQAVTATCGFSGLVAFRKAFAR